MVKMYKMTQDYWSTDRRARKAIDDLVREGLGRDGFEDKSYRLDSQIKIGNEFVYFYGELTKQDNNRAPKLEVGFALQMQPTEVDPKYQAIKESIIAWRLETQKIIGDALGGVSVQIPIYSDTRQYPLVTFEGFATDATRLMRKAKRSATAFQRKGIKLAEWYFPR